MNFCTDAISFPVLDFLAVTDPDRRAFLINRPPTIEKGNHPWISVAPQYTSLRNTVMRHRHEYQLEGDVRVDITEGRFCCPDYTTEQLAALLADVPRGDWVFARGLTPAGPAAAMPTTEEGSSSSRWDSYYWWFGAVRIKAIEYVDGEASIIFRKVRRDYKNNIWTAEVIDD